MKQIGFLNLLNLQMFIWLGDTQPYIANVCKHATFNRFFLSAFPSFSLLYNDFQPLKISACKHGGGGGSCTRL